MCVLLLTLLLIFFVASLLKGSSLPSLLLPEQKKAYKALKEKEPHHTKVVPAAGRRKTTKPASQVVLNSDEGIRAAFYVTWDAGSFASLREYLRQIDILYPEWLHVVTPDGNIQAVSPENKLYSVLQGGKVQPVDDKVMQLLRFEKADMEVLPLINNFDPVRNEWMLSIADMMNDPQARAAFRQQLLTFLASDDKYKGINLDFEGFPAEAQAGYKLFVQELHEEFRSRGLKLHISVPATDPDYDYAFLAANSDGLVLMNYDEHYAEGDPGAISSQQWFTNNLIQKLKIIPRDKIICGVGSYGYDWLMPDRHAPKKAPGSDVDFRAGGLALRNRRRFHHRFRFRQSQSALRLSRRQQPQSRSLVPGRRYRDEPDESRKSPWDSDLRALAPGIGRPLAVGDMGSSTGSECSRKTEEPACRARMWIWRARAKFCRLRNALLPASATSRLIRAPD